MEKEQIQKTIATETEAKVVEFSFIKEKRQFKVQQFNARSKKGAADVEANQKCQICNCRAYPIKKGRNGNIKPLWGLPVT
ncbi:Hypothetical protein I595_3192 [Croceitalea dokdonensis DOKDO 023]|uniref:Uncharacterized protein n=1 Tax=Croceitalea dokdonensis DOKDO 023 TaxID=1300341 RepID=A0A0P7AYW3_9FLAO|nr:hypothetical protein [Croceitalea dokdonensis]KPM30696.1 Hypothetical protein I595_3192 [Croceitalea dokdonensis DOKDO 023]